MGEGGMSERLVLIEWEDAQSTHTGWKPVAEAVDAGVALVKSVGWIIADSEKSITVAAHMHGGDCDGDLTIPKGCIKRVVDLVEPPIDAVRTSTAIERRAAAFDRWLDSAAKRECDRLD
jgi:hypothetical protein